MASSSSGGFVGNTCENPRKESCNAIELRSRVVPTPPVREPKVKRKVEGEVEKEVEVENECDEENEGEVGNERKALRKEIENRRRQKKKDAMNDSGPKEVSPYELPYPRAPKKEKSQENTFRKFMEMFNSLQVDIPFAEVLEQMPLYAKFMKELLTKKRRPKEDEPVLMNEECSAIIQSKRPQKKKDPGSFTIPISIGNFQVERALCDLGASINLMPLSLMKRIPGAVAKPTKMQLTLADRSITHPYGILQDVLVRCAEFVFPADFVILDMEERVDTPVLLGRPFLATGRALIDVEMGDLMLRLNDESVNFKVFEGMEPYEKKKPKCFQVEASEKVVKDSSKDEAFMPTFPELKEFPPNWKYVFLNEDSKDPIIISSSLTPLEEEVLLKKFKEAQGGLGFDLNGVIPVLCVTTIKNEEEPHSGNAPLEPPTPSLEELVRKEVMKLVESGMLNPAQVVKKEKNVVKKSKKILPKAKKKTRNKGENKWNEFMSHPVLEKVLCTAQEVILGEKLKRSRVESKMKHGFVMLEVQRIFVMYGLKHKIGDIHVFDDLMIRAFKPYSRAKDYKGWQQQKSKTAFSQENSQSDEGWSKLKKRSCNQNDNGQEDHLTDASTGSKRAVYRNGSETQEPLAKVTKKGEKGHQGIIQSRESGCKITSKYNFFRRKKAQKR
ncbi:hypothetical protein QL285_052091 [Trifolium repens]|nr:hypothetical protein QL285_052091 [Trifolium repens]